MNIYIMNCSNTFNYGSMMMGENFITYFNKISGIDNIYYVESSDEINVTRLRHATNINEIYQVPMNSLFVDKLNKYDYLLSYLKFKDVVSELTYKIDLVIVLGGDDFTEDYGWKQPIINAIKFNILMTKTLKVIMLGQTMGPYYSFRKPIMKQLLKKIDIIYPRDPITFDYLKNLGLINIEITDDLALLPLMKQDVVNKPKKYITYCPSELIYRYSKEGTREDWIDYNIFMINTIMDMYPDKELVLLAHVLMPEEANDRIIVNELYKLINEKYPNRIIVENNAMYPYEVRNYIQQSVFTVSSRMHPLISSIQCEVPIIAISYSSKYWGIIGERYGLGEYLIDVRNFSYSEMKEKFIKIIYRIDKEHMQIQKMMTDNNILSKDNIIKTLKKIKEL